MMAPRGRGWLATIAGVVVLAIGVGFLPFVVKEVASVEAAVALIAAVSGLALIVTGSTLRMRGQRVARRLLAGLGTLVATGLVVMAVAPAIVATNVPRPEIEARPESVGLSVEDVSLTTPDGVRLAGWYVRSTNGAAVVLRHGAGSTRSNVLAQAAVLARHGFGVLMLDARGHGESGGAGHGLRLARGCRHRRRDRLLGGT